ncbi:RBBP9/YdeN family alpha/beta hydrolase [Methylocella sp.]|uniref:RBBP9/YdeN family alpha/beta hydrolase n=1 Tax=Methylocella sp. TaxID=1978226 RepID=UPI0037838D96
MRTADADILLVPGLGGSEPDHWQRRWAARLPTSRVLEQEDFDRPRLDSWRTRLVAEIRRDGRPTILVAHSLGCLVVAHSAKALEGLPVAGAFLVAPPSAETVATLPSVDRAFAATPTERLPFPALVVASRDDPYSSYADAERLAGTLGAELVDAGQSGHLNVESGHGPWPEGLMRFAGFLKTL